MTKVVGVRFRDQGKVYYFDPMEFDIKRGDHVIVETARGNEYGSVTFGIREVEEDKITLPLKQVVRLVTEEDTAHMEENRKKEKDAYRVCLEKIRKHQLEMKLIDVELAFDNSRILFYFTADGRVDFRELVKDLAAIFKTRIELRQIGVRDETRILGGIGICGRPLCCHSYLTDFAPVSIKMAKEQGLSLNPTKISGSCGRLMCCLRNEQETYEYLNSRLPGRGDSVETIDGITGEVMDVNVLRQRVKVLIEEGDEKEIREYPVEELKFRRRKKQKGKEKNPSGKSRENEPEKNREKEPEKEPEKERGKGNERKRERTREKKQRDKAEKRIPDGVQEKPEKKPGDAHQERSERRGRGRGSRRGEKKPLEAVIKPEGTENRTEEVKPQDVE